MQDSTLGLHHAAENADGEEAGWSLSSPAYNASPADGISVSIASLQSNASASPLSLFPRQLPPAPVDLPPLLPNAYEGARLTEFSAKTHVANGR